MHKTEVCPSCRKEIDISSCLNNKMPVWDLINPIEWGKWQKKIQEYDIICCPYCNHKFRTSKARFFGLFKPNIMMKLILLGILIFIIASILSILRDTGLIK